VTHWKRHNVLVDHGKTTTGAVEAIQGGCECGPFNSRYRMCRRWSCRNDGRVASAGVVLLSLITFLSTTEALVSLAALPTPTYAEMSLSQPTGPILCSSLLVADSVATKSTLFQGNPLTNGILEQVRIWEQAEADNIRYGGELERGDAGNKGQVSAYPKLLVPILRMARELQGVETALQNQNGDAPQYNQLVAILNQPSYDKIAFKRVFNAFADNIYYSDPDRANLYLGGGGTKDRHCGAYPCS
jgi:hypothetical protein